MRIHNQRARVLGVVAAAGAALAVASPAHGAGSIPISGTQTVVDENAGTFKMHGSLLGGGARVRRRAARARPRRDRRIGRRAAAARPPRLRAARARPGRAAGRARPGHTSTGTVDSLESLLC
jgi:hypothetical protein